MRHRIVKSLMLLSIGSVLLISSGCSGMKPFYAAGSSRNLAQQFISGKSSTAVYTYVPTTRGFNSEKSGDINLKNGDWRVSVSYPASMKLEF